MVRLVAVVLSLLIPLSVSASADAHQRRRAPVRVQAPPTDENLDRLAMCESRMNPSAVSRNGRYHGAFQFLLSTWRSMPERAGSPATHTYEEQRSSARDLVIRSGWRPFPGCSRRLGFR